MTHKHIQTDTNDSQTHTYRYQRHGSRIQSEVVGSRVTLIKKSWRYSDYKMSKDPRCNVLIILLSLSLSLSLSLCRSVSLSLRLQKGRVGCYLGDSRSREREGHRKREMRERDSAARSVSLWFPTPQGIEVLDSLVPHRLAHMHEDSRAAGRCSHTGTALANNRFKCSLLPAHARKMSVT